MSHERQYTLNGRILKSTTHAATDSHVKRPSIANPSSFAFRISAPNEWTAAKILLDTLRLLHVMVDSDEGDSDQLDDLV